MAEVLVNPTKTTELNEMPFGVWSWGGGTKNHVLNGRPGSPLQDADAATRYCQHSNLLSLPCPVTCQSTFKLQYSLSSVRQAK